MLAQRATAPIGLHNQLSHQEADPEQQLRHNQRHSGHQPHQSSQSHSDDDQFLSQNSLSARSMTSAATSIDVDGPGDIDDVYRNGTLQDRDGDRRQRNGFYDNGIMPVNADPLDDEFYFGESGWTRSPSSDPKGLVKRQSQNEPLEGGAGARSGTRSGYFSQVHVPRSQSLPDYAPKLPSPSVSPRSELVVSSTSTTTTTNEKVSGSGNGPVKNSPQIAVSIEEPTNNVKSPIPSPSRTAMLYNGTSSNSIDPIRSISRSSKSSSDSSGSLHLIHSSSSSPSHHQQYKQQRRTSNADSQSRHSVLSSSPSRKSSLASLNSPALEGVPIRLGKPRRSSVRSGGTSPSQWPQQHSNRAVSELFETPKQSLTRSTTDTTVSTDIDLYDTASEGRDPSLSDGNRSSATSSSHDSSRSGSHEEEPQQSNLGGRTMLKPPAPSGTMVYAETYSLNDEPIIVFPGRSRNDSDSTTKDDRPQAPIISVNTEMDRGTESDEDRSSVLETPIGKRLPSVKLSENDNLISEMRDVVPENPLITSLPNTSQLSVASANSRPRSPGDTEGLYYPKVRSVSSNSAGPSASHSSPQLSVQGSPPVVAAATRSHSSHSLALALDANGRLSPGPGNQIVRGSSPSPSIHLIRSQSASNAAPSRASEVHPAFLNTKLSLKGRSDSRKSPMSPGAAMFGHLGPPQNRPVRPSLSTSLGERDREGLGLSSNRRTSIYSHRTSFSLSRRRNTMANTGITPGTPVDNSASEEIERLREAIAAQRELKRRRKEFLEGDKVLVGTKVSEGHVNYVTAYNMLTGIRVSVSRCTAKINRELRDEDFSAKQKLAFDISGNELTPYAKYDFKFKDYAPWVFRHLRELFKLDPADYLISLTSKYIVSELGSPGKSGSFFYFSRDFRFIIKTIHHSEHKMLRKILKDYYTHVQNNPNTLISQFYGLHRVKLPFGRKIHFVVMNNLFPPHRDIHRTFDLKGSTLGRHFTHPKPGSASSGKRQVVYKDEDFLEQNESIELGPRKREQFLKQLVIDVELLKRLNIMDYSLLIGVHDLTKGNTENIRDTTLHVFEPNAVNAMSKVKVTELRQALVSASPTSINELSVVLDEYQRTDFLFYADNGGFRATDANNIPLNEIYYLGVIDCLTPYTFFKRVETFWKGLSNQRGAISAVPPVEYGDRFLTFIKGIVKPKSQNGAGRSEDQNQENEQPAQNEPRADTRH